MNNIVSIIFEFINLGLLTVVLFFALKKYIFPGIKFALLESLDFKAKLRHKKEKLQEKQILLEREIKRQDDHCRDLMQKVNFWQQQIKMENGQQQAQKNNYHERVRSQAEIQKENYQKNRLAQELAPYIKNKLYESLNNYFVSNIHQEQYFENIIKSIKEK